MGATDLRVLLFVLLLVVLLLPEMSEVEIGGVLSLKRQVDQAAADAKIAREEAASLRATMTLLSSNISANVNNVQGSAVNIQLAATSGLSVQEAAQRQVPDVDPRSEAAQYALQAGSAGLGDLISSDVVLRGLVTYTRTSRGTMLASGVTPSDFDPTQLNEWVESLPHERGAFVEVDDGFGCSFVYDDQKRLLGAVAAQGVLVGPDGQPDEEAETLLAGGLELAAVAYARLLIDLVHEEAP